MAFGDISFDRRTMIFRLVLQVVGLIVFASTVYWWLAYGVAREVADLYATGNAIPPLKFLLAGTRRMAAPWKYQSVCISGLLSALGCLVLRKHSTRHLDWALAGILISHTMARFLVIDLGWSATLWSLILLSLAGTLVIRFPPLFQELFIGNL